MVTPDNEEFFSLLYAEVGVSFGIEEEEEDDWDDEFASNNI